MNATRGMLRLTVLPQEWTAVRPRDCASGEEPCPWPSCHYRIDNPAHPEITCAIDVADEGPLPQIAVAKILGVTQQRVDYVERRAIARARKAQGL